MEGVQRLHDRSQYSCWTCGHHHAAVDRETCQSGRLKSNAQALNWICRATWAFEDVNDGSIAKAWRGINDRSWAVEDCLHRTASSLEGQKALLHAALEESWTALQGSEGAGGPNLAFGL